MDALVTQAPMPYVLLGNSFLRYVELIRTPDGIMLRRAVSN